MLKWTESESDGFFFLAPTPGTGEGASMTKFFSAEGRTYYKMFMESDALLAKALGELGVLERSIKDCVTKDGRVMRERVLRLYHDITVPQTRYSPIMERLLKNLDERTSNPPEAH